MAKKFTLEIHGHESGVVTVHFAFDGREFDRRFDLGLEHQDFLERIVALTWGADLEQSSVASSSDPSRGPVEATHEPVVASSRFGAYPFE